MKLNCIRLFGSYQKIIIAYLLIFIPNQFICAKVKPPNYNFSLNTFEKFKPDTKRSVIDKEFKNGQIYEENSKYIIVKYKIKHIRYIFPIFVQYYQGKILDYWAKLPSYFLHDIFLQSLINKFGKQTNYYHKNSIALYFWKNSKGLRILYSGTCTITCFPVYLYVRNSKKLSLTGVKFLIDKFDTSKR